LNVHIFLAITLGLDRKFIFVFHSQGNLIEKQNGSTSFSAHLSGLRDSDWFQANSTTAATSLNQDIYTGNVGLGTENSQGGLHLAGGNSIIRLLSIGLSSKERAVR